ncbi:MAG: hypothetical protein MK160_02870 [Rhodobacteraceae bacterium]|nr:hypothetical protein [Paracoccaceae bacterium]
MIDQDDLRAAVGAGTLTESQATSLLTLARNRATVRAGRAPVDEPFELFRGFNEVFIVVGLGILFAGFVSLSEAVSVTTQNPDTPWTRAYNHGSVALMAFSGLTLTVLLTRYFTLRRRMIAPSIALSMAVSYFAMRIGLAADDRFGFDFLWGPIAATGSIALFWFWARVPFALMLGALCFAASCYGGAATILSVEPDFESFFLLSGQGVFPFITLGVGALCLAAALRFDLADRYRVTRNAANAFWLHVAAGPMLVNPIAATLFNLESGLTNAILLAFVVVMALFAIAIDRRSFLLSGIGYLIALITTQLDHGGAIAIVLLGVLLITLGAKWEAIRCGLLERLPEFPGKGRLAPWTACEGHLK